MPVWRNKKASLAHRSGRITTRLGCFVMALAIGAMVSGCASTSSPTVGGLDGPPKPNPSRASAEYTLTEADKNLECNVIRGRMKVAIFHMRSEQKLPQSTSLSRGLQGAAAGIFGGTTYGTDPNAVAAKEKARLYAYNGLLKDKDCTTFDLKKELAQ